MLAFTLAVVFTCGLLTGIIAIIALVCYLDTKSDTQTSMLIVKTPVVKVKSEPILVERFVPDILK